jgi:hypothetical protein
MDEAAWRGPSPAANWEPVDAAELASLEYIRICALHVLRTYEDDRHTRLRGRMRRAVEELQKACWVDMEHRSARKLSPTIVLRRKVADLARTIADDYPAPSLETQWQLGELLDAAKAFDDAVTP